MKNKFLIICAAIFFVAIGTQAQTDTMYFYKNGTVIDKIATNTFDSITYLKKNPYLNPNINYGSVMDIDGNTYATVSIGSQVWMAENLKTTRYNDGTLITNLSDNGTWTTTSSPAMCWLSNNIYYKNVYGGLYNWYAVDITATGGRNICPTGWHVPTNAEWTKLTTYLGGESVAGGKLKETGTTHWLSPNIGATNESGFTALPGGNRMVNGTLYGIEMNGYWWCANEVDTNIAWYRWMNIIESKVNSSNIIKKMGYSVRCLKN